MIRWYAICRGMGSHPLVSPLSGMPYVFDAPDKPTAVAYIARVWPEKLLDARSVAEHEALRCLESAAVRAKQYDEALLAFAKTLPVPEEYDEDETQMSLCRDGGFWRAA